MKKKIEALSGMYGGRSILLFLVAVLSLSACDNEKAVMPDENIITDEKAIIPAKDQRFTYKISEGDGDHGTLVTRVTAVKDSAGTNVFSIENNYQYEDGSMVLKYKAFSKGGFTTNEIATSAGLDAMYKYVSEFAVIKSSKLTGFPQRQTFDNKGTVGSKVTFSKEPIYQYLELDIPTEDGDVISAEIESAVIYHEGKVTTEESVTTPAGTFKCSKWEFSYDLETRLTSEHFPAEETAVVYTVHLWTVPGIGIVKSEEVSGKDVTKTELQKIDK
ncbi:TapB family protein [Dyadobacter aurulentus]|uniref:TapB family protein n=1 Tax=Dyadobacter sp. UC 10 TaxID=2605428 RepID=UPI0011F30E92|nr:hypothetical protein [Dyadobacter sp. UC 10]KAA0991221.1 hypothetical protein FXO21_14140 [Dyadobacter sp. UC 10]